MYFSYLPDLQYDTKPISYPFSESDFTITKNFFRRYKVDANIFGYATLYKKYAVPEGQSIEFSGQSKLLGAAPSIVQSE